MANKRIKITQDTTVLIPDRLAKIAATYTDGYVQIRYCGNQIATDVRGTIFLPESLRNLNASNESAAWCYVCHEMGHQGVENDLNNMRRLKKTIIASEAIAAMVCPELSPVVDRLSRPGSRLAIQNMTSSIFGGSKTRREIGEMIVRAFHPHIDEHSYEFEMRSRSAEQQFCVLVNVYEDHRMEAQVSNRWAGAKSFLDRGNESAVVKWTGKAEEIIRSGADQAFDIFGVGLLFSLHGVDIAFLGSTVKAQVDACADVMRVFIEHSCRTSSFGYYDSVNAALATLSRVYRSERAAEPDSFEEDAGGEDAGGEDAGGEDAGDNASGKNPTGKKMEKWVIPGMMIKSKRDGRHYIIKAVNDDGSVEASLAGSA